MKFKKLLILFSILFVSCSTSKIYRGFLVESQNDLNLYFSTKQVEIRNKAKFAKEYKLQNPALFEVINYNGKKIEILLDCSRNPANYFYLDKNGNEKIESNEKYFWNIELEKNSYFAKIEIPKWYFGGLNIPYKEKVHMEILFLPKNIIEEGICHTPTGSPLLVGHINERKGWIEIEGKLIPIALLTMEGLYSMDNFFQLLIDLNNDGIFDYDLKGASDETYNIEKLPQEFKDIMEEQKYILFNGKLYEIFSVSPLGEWIDLKKVNKKIKPKDVLRISDVAPDFEIKTTDGNLFRLSNYKGKVLFLNFWTSKCPAFESQIKDLKRIYEKYHNLGFEILSVNMDGEEFDLESFANKNSIPWHMARDNTELQNNLYNLYKLKGLPYSYLIDKELKIISKNLIPDELEKNLIEIFEN